MIKKKTPNPRISITLTPTQYQQLHVLAGKQAEPVSTVAKRMIAQGLKSSGKQGEGVIDPLQAELLKQIIRTNTTLDHFLSEKKTDADRLSINQLSDDEFVKIVTALQE